MINLFVIFNISWKEKFKIHNLLNIKRMNKLQGRVC